MPRSKGMDHSQVVHVGTSEPMVVARTVLSPALRSTTMDTVSQFAQAVAGKPARD